MSLNYLVKCLKMITKIRIRVLKLDVKCLHPEMVDFGSRQGRSPFATGGVVGLRRGSQKSENAVLGQKMPFPNGD